MNGEVVPFDGHRDALMVAPASELPARLLSVVGIHQSIGDALRTMAQMGREELFDACIDAIESGTLMVAVGGWGLSRLRDAAERGSSWYTTAAARRQVSKNTIYRAIHVYEALMACPEAIFPSMGKLEPTKLAKLNNLDDDDWAALASGEEIAEGVTLESLANISAERLGRVLAQATHAERYTRKKLDAAHKHIEQLGAELTALRARTDWQGDLPLSVTEARQDGVACGEFAQECLVRMESLYRTVLVRGDLSDEDTLREAQLRAGLIPLHTAVLGVAAAATALLRAMQDQVGEFLPTEYTAELALSREECAAVAEKRHYMVTHLDHLPSETRLRNEAVQARAQRLQAKKAGRQRRAGGA